MRAALLVSLAAAALAAAEASAPWFCHGLDCPSYKVVAKNDGYETRAYEKSEWVATNVSGYVYTASMTQGFSRLFKYISGDNADHVNINMTAPVAVSVERGDGPFCKSNFTVHFFVPPHQGKTPVPSNEDVFVVKYPAGRFFVSSYGGFSVDVEVTLKANALVKKLEAAGESFEEDWYIAAGYDAPFKLTNRHNEIWIAEKPSRSSQSVLSLPA